MTADTRGWSRPVPVLSDELTEAFYGHCARGQLCFQRCDDCGAWRHLPRFLCAGCGSSAWSWQGSTGRGRIFSWTVTHQPVHPAFTEVPMTLVIVEMEEGVRLVSTLRATGVAPALDLAVEVMFEPISEGIALPCFRALASQDREGR